MTDPDMYDPELSAADRAGIIEAMALEIARHRMGDIAHLLKPGDLVSMADRRLAFRLVHMAAPLFPLPGQFDQVAT